MSNQRSFFRLETYAVPLIAKIPEEGEHEGKIRDISAGGIAFYLRQRKDFAACEVSFEVGGEKFEFNARLIRVTGESASKFLYACSFRSISEKESARLMRVLLKLDGIRRK